MNIENLRKAQRIYFSLLKDGSTSKKEILEEYYSDEEVRQCLNILAEESNCSIHVIRGTIYLIPQADNYTFNIDYKDYNKLFENRTGFYMAQYIMTVIFAEFTDEIKDVEFIKIENLLSLITDNLEIANQKSNLEDLENEAQFNVRLLYDYWTSKMVAPEDDDKNLLKTTSLKYQIGVLRNTLSLLIKNDLFFLIEDIELRPTKRFKDLIGFILDVDRKDIVEQLFSRPTE